MWHLTYHYIWYMPPLLSLHMIFAKFYFKGFWVLLCVLWKIQIYPLKLITNNIISCIVTWEQKEGGTYFNPWDQNRPKAWFLGIFFLTFSFLWSTFHIIKWKISNVKWFFPIRHFCLFSLISWSHIAPIPILPYFYIFVRTYSNERSTEKDLL